MLWKTLLVAWICGVVMHFLYRPLGSPRPLCMFFPVSENVWEHFKMAFWPLCGAMIFLGVKTGAPWASVALACLAASMHAMFMMFGLFYTYVVGLGVGRCLLWVDILSFACVMLSGYVVGLRVLARAVPALWGGAAAAVLFGIVCLLHRLIFQNPDLPMFREGGL